MKRQPFFQLTQSAVEQLAANFDTPLLVLSLELRMHSLLKRYFFVG